MKKLYACCLLWVICLQPVWSLENSISQITEIDKIDQQIQVGSFQGWDIYLDNQVETDYSGFGLNKIAPLLIENLHGGKVSKAPSIKGINEFAAYLTKLFPEMDVERRGTLTESQLTKIFNLAYDISLANEKARKNIETASLESIGSNIKNAAAEIEEFYLSKLSCEVKTQWQRIKDKSQLSVYVSVIESGDSDEEATFYHGYINISRIDQMMTM